MSSKKEFYLVNANANKHLLCADEKLPTFCSLENFGKPNEIVLFVQIVTNFDFLYSLQLYRQNYKILSIEKINCAGNNWIDNKQKAREWIDARKSVVNGIQPAEYAMPFPKCDKCEKPVSEESISSVAECGLCWTCRTPVRGKSLACKPTVS